MTMNRRLRTAVLLGGSLLWGNAAFAAFAALGPDKNAGVDIKFTGQSEDDRDLGTRDGGDVLGFGLDVRPWLYGRRGDWSGFVMGQAVAASDTIETDSLESDRLVADSADVANVREPDKNYLALREFWVDYAGFTRYPGEHLRLGRQRLRNEDGQWQDTNIEALNWTFDTTLLRANLGAAQRFSDYRTDLDDLAPTDEDRLHVFGDISTQWQPDQWVGIRAHHSRDDGNLANPGEPLDALDKRSNGDLTWLGLHANSDAYNFRNQNPVNYWASVTWLTGNLDSIDQGPTLNGQKFAGAQQSTDVDAWATDLGLRLRLDPSWQVGIAYARGSGDGDSAGEGSGNYRQSGLESNRSAFTGTRSRAHRFGEAFRGELSNLQAATLFGSWQLREDYDASLIYHKFWRVDDNQQIGGSGINARFDDPQSSTIPASQVSLVNGEKDLGQELDLVLTKYFKQGLLPASMSQALDAPSAVVRLRGGVFKPGDA